MVGVDSWRLPHSRHFAKACEGGMGLLYRDSLPPELLDEFCPVQASQS